MINVFNIIKEVASKMQSEKISDEVSNNIKFLIAKRIVLENVEKTISRQKEAIIDEYKEMSEQ
jgi:hypothetical protein